MAKNKLVHLLVTFDVPGAKGGDKRYQKADALLADEGTLMRVFKQIRLLETRTDPRKLAKRLTDITGPKSSVLIVQVAKPYRFVLGRKNPDAALRAAVRAWLKAAT